MALSILYRDKPKNMLFQKFVDPKVALKFTCLAISSLRGVKKSNPPSFFDRWESILSLQRSEFDHFVKASWNAIFPAKKRLQTKLRVPRRSARRNAQVAWGGLRRGSRRKKPKNL